MVTLVIGTSWPLAVWRFAIQPQFQELSWSLCKIHRTSFVLRISQTPSCWTPTKHILIVCTSNTPLFTIVAKPSFHMLLFFAAFSTLLSREIHVTKSSSIAKATVYYTDIYGILWIPYKTSEVAICLGNCS